MRLILIKLLKTNVEKMSVFRLSMIFMKTNELSHHLHDVDEKKGGYQKCDQPMRLSRRRHCECSGLPAGGRPIFGQGYPKNEHCIAISRTQFIGRPCPPEPGERIILQQVKIQVAVSSESVGQRFEIVSDARKAKQPQVALGDSSHEFVVKYSLAIPQEESYHLRPVW